MRVEVDFGRRRTFLHAANMAELSLILAILAGTGARFKSVLLTDGAGAALRGRSTRTGEIRNWQRWIKCCHNNQFFQVWSCWVLTPLRQTCVSPWQAVKLAFGSDVGQEGLAPLHMPWWAHSDSSRHFSLRPLWVHSAVQQGPWLGLMGKTSDESRLVISGFANWTCQMRGKNNKYEHIPACFARL